MIHAVFILGAIGSRDTVVPLCRVLRYAAAYDCDWVTGALPSILSGLDVGASEVLKEERKRLTAERSIRSAVWVKKVLH